MEQAEEDNNFNAPIMLATLKAERDQTIKDKEDAEAQVEQLLKDKADLKLLHQQSKSVLAKLKASLEDAKKQWDTIVTQRTCLVGEVDHMKTLFEQFENDELQWQVRSEAQVDYINHLIFLLEPYMEKSTSIQALPDIYFIEVKARLSEADEHTISNIGEQMEQGSEQQWSVLKRVLPP